MADTGLFIDSDEALADLVARTSTDTIVPLDTEFVRERTYYAQLCLIQIATPKLTACIDCLTDSDLEPLLNSLLDSRKIWLLHSARQDLEVISQHTDRLPARLIDSQIAAGLLGYPPQIGLQDLLHNVLDVKLDKAFARTNWAKRPLPEPAIHYALDDVRYLSELWQTLEKELAKHDRLGWLEEDCQLALDVPLLTPPTTLWARLRGLGSLSARGKSAALSLVEWREKCAQQLNRPRRWILSDELLLRIANTLPSTQGNLASIPEMPQRFVERFGDEILASTANCGGSERLSFVEGHLDKPRPNKNGLKRLQDASKRCAQELGIQPEVLATRQELVDLLVGIPSGRTAKGWRWNQLKHIVAESQQDS
jgi:ribonuclease D